MSAMTERQKTSCPRGHPYTPENTRRYRGGRFCRACHQERTTTPEYRAAKRAYDQTTLPKAIRAVHTANRRAQALGILERLTVADVVDLWDREPACVICGNSRGVDHIVELSRGGANTRDNLQNLCRSCNARKSALKQVAA